MIRQPIPRAFRDAFTPDAMREAAIIQRWRDAWQAASEAGMTPRECMLAADQAVPEHYGARQRATRAQAQEQGR